MCRKNKSNLRAERTSTTISYTTIFTKTTLAFSSTFSLTNLGMGWIILFVCIAFLAILIVIYVSQKRFTCINIILKF